MGFPEYADLPVSTRIRPAPELAYLFETQHIPATADKRRNCVVCYEQGRGQKRVKTICNASQCEGKHMHITGEFRELGFQEFHSRAYYGL